MAVVAVSLHVLPAHAHNKGDITVERVQGEAYLRQQGTEGRLRKGAVVLVPASVRTGHDGMAELRQGATMVSVGPDTLLDFPAPASGESMDRIVQSQGSAFYDVGKRGSRKLRVETPYLVAVIKGTQFSVAVQQDSTSISLVEGSLEILSSEGGASIDLRAGEVAARRSGETAITVVELETGSVRTTATGDRVVRDGNGRAGSGADVAVAIGADERPAAVVPDAVGIGAGQRERDAGAGPAARLPENVPVAIVAGGAGVSADAGVGVGADLGVGADISIDVDADRGNPVSVDAGASLDPGSNGAGVGADVSIDVESSVGAGAQVSVDVSAGPVDVAISTGADQGSGPPIGAGPGNGGVDVGLDVAGVALDVEPAVTPEAESAAPDTGAPGTVVEDVVEDVGGMLGGLLRRPRRP